MRVKVNKKRSARKFRHQVSRTNAKNFKRPSRGGYKL